MSFSPSSVTPLSAHLDRGLGMRAISQFCVYCLTSALVQSSGQTSIEMATFNSSRGSRESGNFRTFVAFQADVSFPREAVWRLAGKKSGSGWNLLIGVRLEPSQWC